GNKHSAALKNEDAAQRKAALEAALRKKIEFEKKALSIVEQLLEEDITEEFLLNCGKYIAPSHYKDIVDERSIIKRCGYPLCQNKLENVPKQKYRISTKTNRVYDITERKCFCSNFCYRASKYFEAQISKSPVWMREEEKSPDIELLKEGQSGQSGEEVKLRDEVIKASDIENPRISSDPCESASHDTASDSSTDTEQEFVSSVLPGSQSSSASVVQQLHRKSILKKKHAQKVHASRKTEDADVVEATEQLSHCISSANQETEELDEDDLDTADDLNTVAVGESENTLNYSLPFTGPGGIAKPVPSYEKLKEETEFLELRVKEFYEGKYTLAEEAVTQAQAGEHPSKDKDDQQEDLTFPLVDSNAQTQIRKRIVLEKLTKALSAVLGPLQIASGDVYTELKNLVKTFRLTNRNIIHKMPEWTLIAIVLLSVLSQTTPLFKNTQTSPIYTQFLTTLLEELHFKNEDLESLTRIFRMD
ncbi:RPAP2 phosphatase, partial [Dryoscopus gambensis]|nr:RPAP2 phosphatase [Dryoscopus gambensis]